MKKFKQNLDKNCFYNYNKIYISNYKTKNIMNKTLMQIDINFSKINTDPIIKKVRKEFLFPKKIKIIQKEKVEIKREINNLNDLILIINDFPYAENAEYNINMEKLYKIKDSLIELNEMIGIYDIKNNIVDQLLFYLQDLHLKNGINYMHTVLYGPPGTGKTEIAKIIGKIFCKLEILKKGSFTKVVRADLIAGYLGQTAIKTSKVIEQSLGGVLFIDEAYSLGNSEKRDSFSKECIDTLCEALSNHREKLMVIIAGYEKELKECFFSYNPGLESRFPWIFKTDNSSPEELFLIFCKMVKKIKWKLYEGENKNKLITKEFFIKNKENFPYFGRDMEILLLKITMAHGRRVFCLNLNEKTIIIKQDLEKGFELFKKNFDNNENKRENLSNFFMYS